MLSPSSSSEDNDQYAALSPYPGRRRRSPPRAEYTTIIYLDANNSLFPRPKFKLAILSACRQGDIKKLERMLADATLVPARPDKFPITDEMVMEALDAPGTLMLTVVIRRDPSYRWSDLAILKAVEKDRYYNQPQYLEAFMYLGLSPHTVCDKQAEHYDALMWAIRAGSPEYVAMLLFAGANPNGAKVG